MATVLIIDDDDLIRAYLRTLLQRDGHDVVALADGSKVAAAVGDHDIDVIVTDLYMPNSDGIETLRLLNEVAPGIPVVCVTGSITSADDPCAKMMQLLGAQAILHKPLHAPDLLQALARALASRTSRSNGVMP